MLRDLTNPKKIDKQAVLAAISALRARAWDINPYTVGDEMKTSRTNIYRNSEVMELINEARREAGLPMIHVDETQSESTIEPTQEVSDAAQSVAELQDRIQRLEAENAELQELQKDNWQRGYKAGWDEASIYLVNAAPFPTEPMDSALISSEDAAKTESVETTYNSEPYPEPPNFSEDESNYTTQTVPWSYDTEYTNEEPTTEEKAEAVSAEETEEAVSAEELHNILKQHRDKAEGDAGQTKAKGLAASKFARPNEPTHRGFILRTVPPDIRKSCLVLGIRPEELSRQAINDAWKREITRPGTHPDQGGDGEIAVYLNTAKDVLLRWWETQEPKLGKQFGSQSKPVPGAESEPDETEPSM